MSEFVQTWYGWRPWTCPPGCKSGSHFKDVEKLIMFNRGCSGRGQKSPYESMLFFWNPWNGSSGQGFKIWKKLANSKNVHLLKNCSRIQKSFFFFVHKFKKNRGVSNNICIQNFVPNLENVMFQNISTKIKK